MQTPDERDWRELIWAAEENIAAAKKMTDARTAATALDYAIEQLAEAKALRLAEPPSMTAQQYAERAMGVKGPKAA